MCLEGRVKLGHVPYKPYHSIWPFVMFWGHAKGGTLYSPVSTWGTAISSKLMFLMFQFKRHLGTLYWNGKELHIFLLWNAMFYYLLLLFTTILLLMFHIYKYSGSSKYLYVDE